MTSKEAFLQRCKNYTFPRSAEIASLIEAGHAIVPDGCAEQALPAAVMLRNYQERLDSLGQYSCSEAEPYRHEIAALCAKLAERPQDSLYRWTVLCHPHARLSVEVWEWASDYGFVYGSEGTTPAAVAFSRWQWDHPPGVNSLEAPWEMLPADSQISILWRSGLGQDIPEAFMHGLKHMPREDRARWSKMHPPPPEWERWMSAAQSHVERLEQQGLLPETNPWIEIIQEREAP